MTDAAATERRSGLERRMATVEGQLGQLAHSYQHMAVQFDKLASRAEVEALRTIVSFICAGAVMGIVGALFFRMISR